VASPTLLRIVVNRRRAAWAGLIVLLAGLWLARPLALRSAADFLDVGGPEEGADYVMVLGGGYRTRPVAAAALVRRGLARAVLVPRGKMPADGEWSVAEHVRVGRVLRWQGVPADRVVVLDGEVDSTADEAAALRRFLDAHPGVTVTVVTDAFHTRRTRTTFGRVLGAKAGRVHYLAAPADRFDARDWQDRREAVQSYAAEYVKLLRLQLRGP
jgi:uncharacterized SAM-binding protein YcdF (DUF218 family)